MSLNPHSNIPKPLLEKGRLGEEKLNLKWDLLLKFYSKKCKSQLNLLMVYILIVYIFKTVFFFKGLSITAHHLYQMFNKHYSSFKTPYNLQ